MAVITEEQRSIIVSEDYANLIIDYHNNPQLLNAIPDSTFQIMNETFGIVYVPVSQAAGNNYDVYGYSVTPKLYILTSEEALEASGVNNLRNIPNFNLRGTGTLIGIVDTGINYSLPIFRNTDGTSRIYSLWDQTIQSDNFPRPELFGTEYSQEQINQAIGSEDPLSVVPSTDENGHGTMLAAVAAGLEVENEEFAGVAPGAELIIVKLHPAKQYLRDFFVVPEQPLCYQEDYIMWGVQYCVEAARRANRPIAICLGLGTSQGSHDGRTNLGQLCSILANAPRTGIVTSAGNEGNLGRHFRGTIDPNIGNVTVELTVAEGEYGFSMELWGDTPGIYSMDILSPSGEYIPRITAGLRINREIAFIFEQTVINIEYRTVETGTGDQLIFLRFRNVSSGTWRFTVFGQGDLATSFNIWLPMGDLISTETRFVQPDIYTTVLDPGTSDLPLTITAYNPINNTLYVNAGRGFTRTNDVKPELAAPGVGYTAPDNTGSYAARTGTGVAAAHATGIVALVLEWGVAYGFQPNISTVEIKNYLIRGAKRSANLTYPNRDFGYGILDIFNTFNIFRITS